MATPTTTATSVQPPLSPPLAPTAQGAAKTAARAAALPPPAAPLAPAPVSVAGNAGTRQMAQAIAAPPKPSDAVIGQAEEGMKQLKAWVDSAYQVGGAWEIYRAALDQRPAALPSASDALDAAAKNYNQHARWLLEHSPALQATLVAAMGAKQAAPMVKLLDEARQYHLRVFFEQGNKMGVAEQEPDKLRQLMDQPTWHNWLRQLDPIALGAYEWKAPANAEPNTAKLVAYAKISPAILHFQRLAFDAVMIEKTPKYASHFAVAQEALTHAASELTAPLQTLHGLAKTERAATHLEKALRTLQTLVAAKTLDWKQIAVATVALEKASSELNTAVIPRS